MRSRYSSRKSAGRSLIDTSMIASTRLNWRIPCGGSMAALVAKRPQRVHQLGALTNQPLPAREQNGSGLLLLRLRLDKPHLWPLRRNHDCFGVVLLPHHVRFHVLWSDQLHLIAELDHFLRPTMRAAAGFHHHHSRGQLCHELSELGPGQLFAELHCPDINAPWI